MHTITAPPSAPALLALPPHPDQDLRLRDLVALDTGPSLLWRANHLGEYLPVTGGNEQVRLLTHAIDGDWWPFTVITTTDQERCFEVLGTVDACIFEIGTATDMFMVARRNGPAGKKVALPAECQHWVAAANESELFTADVATHLGARYLRGHSLPYGFEVRPIYRQSSTRLP